MADGKPISKDDIIDPGIIKEITAELKGLKTAMSEGTASSNVEDFNKGLSHTVEITEDLIRIKKNEIRIDKEIILLEIEQAALGKKEIKEKARIGAAIESLKAARQSNNLEMKNEAKQANSLLGSMNQLSLSLAKNKKAYRDLTEAERKNNAIGGKLLKTIKKQDTEIKKLDKSLGDNQRNVGNYSSALSGMGGIMGTVQMKLTQVITVMQTVGGSMKAATAATSLTSKAMKILKVALISTGIGALVIGIIALVTWFKKTVAGGQALERVLAPISAIFDVIVNRVGALGGAIAKLFSGDFTGAWEDTKEAVSGINEELTEQIKLYKELAERDIALRRTQRANIELLAILKKVVGENRLAARDEKLSFEERIAAQKRAQKAILTTQAIQRAALKEELDLLVARKDVTLTDEEALESIALLKAEITLADAAAAKEQLKLVEFLLTLRNKQAAAEKQALEDSIEKQVTEVKLSEEKQESLEDFFKREENLVGKSLENFVTAEQAKTDAIKEQEQLRLESQDRLFEATNQALTASAKLFEEDTAQFKILAIAQATLNAYLAAAKALTTGATVIDRIAGAVAVLAVGLGFVSEMGSIALAEGTDEVKGGVKGKDSVRAMLMPGERVLTVEQNKQLNGISNNEIPGLVAMGKSGGGYDSDMKRLTAKQVFLTEQGNQMLGRLCWLDSNGTVHNLRNNNKTHIN